ncbi:hypothetical protein NC651_035090 [Populus alba x Populus x berolinensis]|nr:hypothetical protein NC651_035090 [Populus alba x Populus x berolinensis]
MKECGKVPSPYIKLATIDSSVDVLHTNIKWYVHTGRINRCTTDANVIYDNAICTCIYTCRQQCGEKSNYKNLNQSISRKLKEVHLVTKKTTTQERFPAGPNTRY